MPPKRLPGSSPAKKQRVESPEQKSGTGTAVVNRSHDLPPSEVKVPTTLAERKQEVEVDLPNKREFSDEVASVSQPDDVKVGDTVSYEGGVMKGVVAEVTNDGWVKITPTHAEGDPIQEDDFEDHVDKGSKTFSIRKGSVHRETGEIKRITTEKVTIVHFNSDGVTAAEYIRPPGADGVGKANDIEVTAHALGTGVYGIHDPTDDQRAEAKKLSNGRSKEYEVTMMNPLYLQNGVHGAKVTSLSKALQELATKFRPDDGAWRDPKDIPDWLSTQPEFTAQANKLRTILVETGKEILKVEAKNSIASALQAFFTKYYSGNPLVEQPINFLLTGLRYDGIYATDAVNNAFARGCVAYTVPNDAKQTAHTDRPL